MGAAVERRKAAWLKAGNIETWLLSRRLAKVPIKAPVFVTGLARAGTTILLQKLGGLPDFASHRYDDFPFLYTPFFWNWLKPYAVKPTPPAERWHKDGIVVDSASPEAMEEVLWMAFFDGLHDPTHSQVLGTGVRKPAFEAFFAAHVKKLLLARGAGRYLSKNNYDVVRLAYLGDLFPSARFVIPIRSPAAHVASLIKQHRLFLKLEEGNPEITAHLARVGHFEFGHNRVPINTGDGEATAEILRLWASGDEASGWALQWATVYGHVADLLESDGALARMCAVVRHEDLCAAPAETMAEVLEHIGVDANAARLAEGLGDTSGYYDAGFSAADAANIAAITGVVAKRLGY